MTICSCLHFKGGGREEPLSKAAALVSMASVPEHETDRVRTCHHPQSGNTDAALLPLSPLWVLADLIQKWWPELFSTTPSADLRQGGGAAVRLLVIHPLKWEPGEYFSSPAHGKQERYKLSNACEGDG